MASVIGLCIPVYAAEEVAKNRLDMALASELLIAAKAELSFTKQEKLFVHRCDMVKKYVGFANTPTGNAIKYSCTAPVVGVAFYAGNDLGEHSPEKIADYIKSEFDKHGMMAKVFIDTNHQYGSSVSLIMNGGGHLYNPVNPLTAIKSIEGFAAEAKLILFNNKKVSSDEYTKWVKATTAYIPQ